MTAGRDHTAIGTKREPVATINLTFQWRNDGTRGRVPKIDLPVDQIECYHHATFGGQGNLVWRDRAVCLEGADRPTGLGRGDTDDGSVAGKDDGTTVCRER